VDLAPSNANESSFILGLIQKLESVITRDDYFPLHYIGRARMHSLTPAKPVFLLSRLHYKLKKSALESGLVSLVQRDWNISLSIAFFISLIMSKQGLKVTVTQKLREKETQERNHCNQWKKMQKKKAASLGPGMKEKNSKPVSVGLRLRTVKGVFLAWL
jgi:hypothetical protein